MLPKHSRLGTKELEAVFKTGRPTRAVLFLFRAIPAKTAKFGVSVPKHLATNAVERNAIRRKFYTALALTAPFPPIHGVFVAQRPSSEIDASSLAKEIKSIFIQQLPR